MYTLEQLKHLRNVRAKGFNKNESPDDLHTNARINFEEQTLILIEWIERMERKGQIDELLSTMPKPFERFVIEKHIPKEMVIVRYYYTTKSGDDRHGQDTIHRSINDFNLKEYGAAKKDSLNALTFCIYALTQINNPNESTTQ